MLARLREAPGFVAALDQSGGSTPKALGQYGISEDGWSSEAEMFDLVHEMRTRIMTSKAFDSSKIIAAILFEQTMDREVDGLPTAKYLWERKGIVPILKTDKGLQDEVDGSKLMKPVPDLDSLLERAVAAGIAGTKMRSVISSANEKGIAANVAQQFEFGNQILGHGLMPIVEPEVDIHAPDKVEIEEILRREMISHLDSLTGDNKVMIKITIPSVDDYYRPVIEHPNCWRLVALSGGYSREESNERLARNHGLIASFSRALTEGLSVQQSQEEFDATLGAAVESIYQASIT